MKKRKEEGAETCKQHASLNLQQREQAEPKKKQNYIEAFRSVLKFSVDLFDISDLRRGTLLTLLRDIVVWFIFMQNFRNLKRRSRAYRCAPLNFKLGSE